MSEGSASPSKPVRDEPRQGLITGLDRVEMHQNHLSVLITTILGTGSHQKPLEEAKAEVEQPPTLLCLPKGETGLLVVKITKNTPFYGYAGDSQKTEKKILRDVLAKGDAFFNSGDLLMMDHEKFIYFQDRVGDTFR